ncbi:hypothetical protein [Sphingomonas sp. UYP23]
MQNRASLRERRSIAQTIRHFWREIEPGIDIQHNSFIEAWNGEAEGPASVISFEGFGVTFLFFVGRTPKAVRS